MLRPPAAALTLADRLCRPQRIGVFGHRGVGKTTLLTMLYREAVGGRLPGLRLAAADTRTAEYLSDKVVQLESGQALPGTLAETDLRFHLYHGETRLELLLKDYQGEHVELGRQGPIREFLRDCDAVWLCLDLATVPAPAERLRRQQEIEQLIEDYLAAEPRRTMDRPAALVLTKADLLGPAADDVNDLARLHFGMTRHALDAHCPNNGLFAVSSLGPDEGQLQPRNLDAPLAWLATALQKQDEARMEQVWALAGRHLAVLERCVACFARRYPDAEATQVYRHRLRLIRQQQRRRRSMAGVAAAACLIVGLWAYDAQGQRAAERFEADHADEPAIVLLNWQEYQAWHPTRYLLGATAPEQEENRLRELTRLARERERDGRLAELRRQGTNPDADPEKVWQQYQEFRGSYPELDLDTDLQPLRAVLKARRDEQYQQRAGRAFDELTRTGQRASDLNGLVVQADRYLRDFPDSLSASEVRRLRSAALRQLDEQDIQAARQYSARQPLNFQTRREHYQRYLDRHPAGGAFTNEARTALRTIDEAWDKHDFRQLRDQFMANPGDIPELVSHCRRYLAVHPKGKFAGPAAELLRWSERVTAPGEYKVVLRNGQFDNNVARWISRGPKLSVELEVAGVRYGPSTIVYNRYDPEWDFEFPRRIRWKHGDAITIRVTEHTWKNRQIAEINSSGNDALALRMLTGDVYSGTNRMTFECDFAMPVLPTIE